MKVVVLASLHENARQMLEADFEVVYAGWAMTEPVLTPLPGDDEIINLARDAEAIIVPGELAAEVIRSCAHLRVIGVARGDPRGVDLELAFQRGVTVVYAAGRNAAAVAEITIAFIIMLFRQLLPAHEFVKGKKWRSWDDLFATPLIDGLELTGRTLGMVGFGYVGREVAQRARAFGMRLLVYDPYVDEEEIQLWGGSRVGLDQLLAESDVVSLHCKLTEETRGMIGREELQRMKSGTFFINTSRAAVVDREALLEALLSGRLAGAALDVYWEEPLDVDSPFLGLPQVICTPHIGSGTVDVEPRTSLMVARDVRAVLKGEKPEHPANRVV